MDVRRILQEFRTHSSRYLCWGALLLAVGFAVPGIAADPPCPDSDVDGYADCSGVCDAAALTCGDCDDFDFDVNPGVAELCDDGVNNDCDGATPDVFDGDGDGFDCNAECDDSDAAVNPDATEICGDGIDNDCYMGADTVVQDPCFFTAPPACDPSTPGCCAVLGLPICDGVDAVCQICAPDLSGIDPNDPPPEVPIDLASCHLPGPAELPVNTPEVGGNAECFDGADNDCDGLIDHEQPGCQTAEVCNGFDDDFNGMIDETFLDLGDACNVGVGVCANTGTVQCSGDGASTVCDAVPGNPKTENTPGSGRCVDGKDNNCDGLTDLNDPGCQTAEVCDGLDNDGNEGADEDFADLGQACSAGLGACLRDGLRVCKGDGSGTRCSAMPGAASTEGPVGATCEDGLDNDCDDLVDLDDPECGSVNLGVGCSLEYLQNGPNGASCVAWHRIAIDTGNVTPGASVVAELLGVDADGNIVSDADGELAVLEVADQEVVHLASRISPDDWKWKSKKNKRGGGPLVGPGDWHEMFAPIPLLRVTVDDGLNRKTAYCSNVPFLDVIRPMNTVVTESEGEFTPVEVAIPGIDPTSLEIRIDGVDVIAGLGLNPATDLPGGPFDGTVLIGGDLVQIEDLVVSSAPIDVLAANAVTMQLSNLGCGGHIVLVEGQIRPGALVGFDVADGPISPISPVASMAGGGFASGGMATTFGGSANGNGGGPPGPTPQCHVDDGEDKGISMVFEVKILSPNEGQVVPGPGVGVLAEVCHGMPIIAADINGRRIADVSGQVLTPGDGEFSADTYVLSINENRGTTDLAQDFDTGDAPLGTFDPGSNRLVASATDERGNRAYDDLIFGVGSVLRPTPSPLGALAPVPGLPPGMTAEGVLGDGAAQVNFILSQLAESYMEPAIAGAVAEIDNAYVIGISEDAVQAVIDQSCANALQEFKEGVAEELPPGTEVGEPIKVGGGCSCDPTVRTRIVSVNVGNNVSCDVTFVQDKIDVAINLPDIAFTLRASGSCKTTGKACIPFTDACVTICLAETVVDTTFNTSVTDIGAEFDITEDQLLGLASPNGVTMGACENDASIRCNAPSDCGGNKCVVGNFSGTGNITAEVNCLASVCNWIADLGIAFINLFGADVDPLLVSFSISPEFSNSIGAAEPDPIDIGEINVGSLEFEEVGQRQEGALTSVSITPEGLIAGLRGTFETIEVDPTVPANPGAQLTPAPLPTFSQTPNANVYLGLSDDAFNMMFASLVDSGKLKQGCQASGSTIGDLLPADCLDIQVASICQGGTNNTLACIDDTECPGGGVCKQSAAASAVAAGICQGIKAQALANPGGATGAASDSCESLAIPADLVSQTLAQGTCHGVRNATCSAIPGGPVEKAACNLISPIPLAGDNALLFCVQQDLPPNLKFRDGAAAGVQAILRLGDMAVTILVDRGAAGLDGEFSAAPSCFGEGTAANVDCSMFGVCLDLNLETTMQFQTCSDGRPGLVNSVDAFQITIRPGGAVCGGGVSADDGLITQESVEDSTVIDLADTIEMTTPPICSEGLTLAGEAFTITNPTLFVIETDGMPDFQDYLAIGDVD